MCILQLYALFFRVFKNKVITFLYDFESKSTVVRVPSLHENLEFDNMGKKKPGTWEIKKKTRKT